MRELLAWLVAWLSLVPAKARVVVASWPARAAAGTAVLTVISIEVVPLLPGPWAVQVGGWITTMLGAIAVVSAAVARLTPILFPEDKGILPPAPQSQPSTGTYGSTATSSATMRYATGGIVPRPRKVVLHPGERLVPLRLLRGYLRRPPAPS